MKRLVLILFTAIIISNCGCSAKSPRTPGGPVPTPLNTPVSIASPAPSLPPVNTPQPASTPSPVPIAKALRFIVMADSRGDDNGINTNIIKKTMNKIKQLSPQPRFALMPGDLCDGAKSFQAVKSQLEHFKKVVTQYYPIDFFYPGIGNHETRSDSGGEKAFGEVFTEFKGSFLSGYNRSVYYFDEGNTRFFMLNSNHPGEQHQISDVQYSWLKSSLDSSKKNNMFFVHEPAYPTGSHVGSSLDSNRFKRDRLWQLVDSSSRPMVFCGHEHNYARRHINSDFNESINGVNFSFQKNVFQLTVGSFGAPLYKEYTSKKGMDVPPIAKYHFAVVDIRDRGIEVTAYDLDGNIIDQFEQTKW